MRFEIPEEFWGGRDRRKTGWPDWVITDLGYRYIRVSDWVPITYEQFHQCMVSEHLSAAESTYGGRLPKGAQVHHADQDRLNNKPSNLVICQDRKYHMLLHRRLTNRAAGLPKDQWNNPVPRALAREVKAAAAKKVADAKAAQAAEAEVAAKIAHEIWRANRPLPV